VLKQKALVLVKTETTYGVDSIPVGGVNAILCEEPAISFQGTALTSNALKPTLGAKKSRYVGEALSLSFTTEVRGSGTAGTAPETSPLFRACRFTEVIDTGVSVEYHPNSDDAPESATIYFYQDGILYKLLGARGTATLDAKTNEIAKIKWDMKGIFAGPVDATLPSATFNPLVSPVFQSAAATLDSYAVVFDALNITFGNTLAVRKSANAATGILEHAITERAITGSIDPEKVRVADKDWFSVMSGGASVAFTATIGQGAGNKCVITAPAVQITEMSDGDRDGILTNTLNLSFVPTDAGDDEIVFSFQ